MKIIGNVIKPNKIKSDKNSKTDELKITLKENSNLSIIHGKRAKETVVSVEDSKVYVNSKSKFFWNVDEVKVKDAEYNDVLVEKSEKGYSFETVSDSTYLITVFHKFRALLVILLAVIVVALILCSSTLFNKPVESKEQAPIGNYAVGDKREAVVEEKVQEEIPTITFSGFGKFTVSEKKTDIELHNPKKNFVNMQFEIIDDISGETIAITDLVPPSKYAYVNVMDFYKDKKGEFDVTIQIRTFTDDGAEMNGLTEKMVLIIE